MRQRARAWMTIFVWMGLLAAPASHAQTTTGRIIGSTSDGDGRVLPGVTVSIASPVLIGGMQTRVTGADGSFQFIGLHPGAYTVAADLAGFVSQERREVKVPLGGAAALTITMPSARFEGEIEVAAETPVVDPTQSNTGQVFDYAYLQNSAIGSFNRAYQAVLRQAAGVAGGYNPNVYGSPLNENAVFIDGQDTTDPLTATWGSIFNFDSIAEVELQTAGFEAEYGRATGGLVNVVTRTGGNRFSGALDLRYRARSFQRSGEHYDADELDSSFELGSVTLGGPVIRDRLWFFAAYEFADSEQTPNGSPVTRDFEGSNYNAKLTWQADPSWRLTARFSGSPAEIASDNASRFVVPEAASFQSQGTDLYAVEANGLLSEALVWNTVVGAFRSKLDVEPLSGDLSTPSHLDLATGILSDNYNVQQYSERSRDDVATDLTWFADFGGVHELKAGVQYSATEVRSATCATGTSGGACTPGSLGYAYQDASDRRPFFLIESVSAGYQRYSGELWTAYLQDAWRVVPTVTLKLGLRYDTVAYDNNIGSRVAELDRVQPRIGAAWDLTGNAKNVVRASWGRFMSPSSLALADVLRFRNQPVAQWASCTTLGPVRLGADSAEACAARSVLLGWQYRADDPDGLDPWGWFLSPFDITGATSIRVDPGLSSAYADALILSFERELGRRASVEVSFVDKKTRSLFEDTCNGNIPVPALGASCDFFFVANLEPLARDYRALILKYETRTFDWLTVLASYTYSTSKGSLDFSQGANPDFDYYPYYWVNRYGFLSDHRRHRLKLNGYVSIKGDWTVTFDAFWSSPFRWQPVADFFDDPTIPPGFSAFAEPRGSRDAFTASNVDLQVAKGLTVGRTRLSLIGSVYNAFSTEYGTVICPSIGGCGDVAMGEALDHALPRRFELGFRVEF